MYFPYDYPDYYAEIKTETDKFGYNGYNSFFDRFLSIMGTGQMNYSVRMITVIILGMTIQITIPIMYQMSWK